jgi:hypothetical protein
MGQHNAKLMLSTLWCGQLTRLSGGRRSGHQNRDCRTARSNRKTCPSDFDALRTVYGTTGPMYRPSGQCLRRPLTSDTAGCSGLPRPRSSRALHAATWVSSRSAFSARHPSLMIAAGHCCHCLKECASIRPETALGGASITSSIATEIDVGTNVRARRCHTSFVAAQYALDR